MARNLSRGIVLGVLATLAGLVLQCASSVSFFNDGGVTGRSDGVSSRGDRGIGPFAEAGTPGTAVTRTTLRINTIAPDRRGASKATICGLPGSLTDPPAITLYQTTDCFDATGSCRRLENSFHVYSPGSSRCAADCPASPSQPCVHFTSNFGIGTEYTLVAVH